MKTFSLLALAAVAKLASAHATIFAVWVNDVDQGLSNSGSTGYIRNPPNNDPVKDVTSSDMTCNVGGSTAAAKTIDVKGGDKITLEWHHNTRDDSDDIIASSHKGPVMTYIAPTSSNGQGDVWIKLAEEGLLSDGTWAVDKLIADKGKHSITLPDLAAGEYLLRGEIIALHEANNAGGAQFYMECVQIRVTSSGTKTLPAGVAIPGAYTAQDAGILFNMYYPVPTSYPIPGPAVWDGTSGTPATSSAAVPASSTAATAVASSAVASSASSAPAVSTPAADPTTAVAQPTAPAATTSAVAVPTTLQTATRPATSAASSAAAQPTSAQSQPSSTPGNSSGTVAKYYQCGGLNYSGATACVSGTTCKEWNPYYSQCV